MSENELAKVLVDIFYNIHVKIGPGLLESVYEEIICHELDKKGLKYKRQIGIPVVYDNKKMNLGFRADIIVEDKIIVEIKSVELMASVFSKQLLTYLRLTDKKLGLLVNFNVNLIKEGITRVVNKL